MKLLRKIALILIGVLGFLTIAFLIAVVAFHEEIPEGETGAPADALASKMLAAINHDAFMQCKSLQFTFLDKNHYDWNVKEGKVRMAWEDFTVLLDTRAQQAIEVLEDGKAVDGAAREEAVSYAWSNFNNDSFWVAAPFKVMDPGTVRTLVEKDGKQQLLVTYQQGGTTPNDSYLWTVDDQHFPISYKMWVSIVPLDGVEATWNDWYETSGDFYLARNKNIYGIDIPVTVDAVLP
jgi:hypothetical protein